MVRLILIAAAVFLAVYPLSRRFSLGQKNNVGEGDVVGPHSRLGISLGGLLQKAMAFFPVIRALLPF